MKYRIVKREYKNRDFEYVVQGKKHFISRWKDYARPRREAPYRELGDAIERINKLKEYKDGRTVVAQMVVPYE
jgi:hypothetical protein